MSNSARSNPPGQPGTRAPARLNYEFDAVPKIAVDLVASGRLKPFDLEVLALLLRFPRHVVASCWTTWATIAALITSTTRKRKSQGTTVHEDTIKRSVRRMKAEGILRHIQVEVPDPQEPRNKTGWRIVFTWMENPRLSLVTPNSEGDANEHPPPVQTSTPI